MNIKKITYSAIILLMALFAFSCSIDNDTLVKTLELKSINPISNGVVLNDEILFEVLDGNGKAVSGATIFVNDKVIEGYKYKAQEVGSLLVVATKDGYIKSKPIRITVTNFRTDFPGSEKIKLEKNDIIGKWKLENDASHNVFYNFYENNTFDLLYFGAVMKGEYRIEDNRIHLDMIPEGEKIPNYSVITVLKLTRNEIDIHVTVIGVHEKGKFGRLVRQKEEEKIDLKKLVGQWKAIHNNKEILKMTFNSNGTSAIEITENANKLPNLEGINYIIKYKEYSPNTIIMNNRNGGRTFYLTLNNIVSNGEIKATLYEAVIFPQKSTSLVLQRIN